MKKTILFGLLALALSSCSIHKSSVSTTSVKTPAIETATFASLNVGSERITYTYVPSKNDAKSLSENALVNNAMYMALAQNGNADVLVRVNYYTTTHRGLFGKRVKSIMISGYPAYYVDFREPRQADLEMLESVSYSKMLQNSTVNNKPFDEGNAVSLLNKLINR